MSEYSKSHIEREFQKLDSRRTNKLNRARDCARLTVPTLFPREGYTESMELPDLYNSMPARGIMSLASRIVSAMYPLNQQPFFTFEPDAQFVPEGQDLSQTMASLSRLDKRIMNKISHSNLRQELFVLMQHLIVLGDALFEIQDDYNFKVHRVDHYVLQRFPDGRIKKIILREWVDPEALPETWMTAIADQMENGSYSDTENQEYDSFVQTYNQQYAPSKAHKPLYTYIEWEEERGMWECKKEYCGYIVDAGEFEVCPYIPQTWARIAGEDYGRSLVEEHIGDIRTLEAITKSLVEAAIANSEHRIGIDPSGITEISDLQNTQNGDYVAARQQDIFTVQLSRGIDLGPMVSVRNELTTQLGRVFLLNSSIQRQAERVTATEVRLMAEELDQSLGGVFSGLAQSIQIPIVKRTVILMAKDRLLQPEIVKLIGSGRILSLKVRTGLEALNREIEASLLFQWQQATSTNPAFQDYIDSYGFLMRLTTSMGLDSAGLVKSPQQLQAEQQAAAEASMQAMVNQQLVQSGGAIAESAGSAAANAAMEQGQPQEGM